MLLNNQVIRTKMTLPRLRVPSPLLLATTSQYESLRKEREELKTPITDLQWRFMKYNIMFSGLVENSNENTEEVLSDFIYNDPCVCGNLTVVQG